MIDHVIMFVGLMMILLGCLGVATIILSAIRMSKEADTREYMEGRKAIDKFFNDLDEGC